MQPYIEKAFNTVKRKDFVPREMLPWASLNEALPIGYEQTISQPQTVAFMLEKLDPKEGHKILDIGSGSGWTTALLASLVGSNGKVVGIELVPELAEFGKNNVSKYGFIKQGIVEFIAGDGSKGYPRYAPYDRILVSASLDKKKLPEAWNKQLVVGGKIVIPIKNSIWLFIKKSEHKFEEQEFPGFAFVPFLET